MNCGWGADKSSLADTPSRSQELVSRLLSPEPSPPSGGRAFWRCSKGICKFVFKYMYVRFVGDYTRFLYASNSVHDALRRCAEISCHTSVSETENEHTISNIQAALKQQR